MRTAILTPSNPRFPSAATHLASRPVGSADGRTSRQNYLFELLLVTPAVEKTPEQVETLKAGNVELTPEQWAAYPTGGDTTTDEAYEHACVLANLGLTAA